MLSHLLQSSYESFYLKRGSLMNVILSLMTILHSLAVLCNIFRKMNVWSFAQYCMCLRYGLYFTVYINKILANSYSGCYLSSWAVTVSQTLAGFFFFFFCRCDTQS